MVVEARAEVPFDQRPKNFTFPDRWLEECCLGRSLYVFVSNNNLNDSQINPYHIVLTTD